MSKSVLVLKEGSERGMYRVKTLHSYYTDSTNCSISSSIVISVFQKFCAQAPWHYSALQELTMAVLHFMQRRHHPNILFIQDILLHKDIVYGSTYHETRILYQYRKS